VSPASSAGVQAKFPPTVSGLIGTWRDSEDECYTHTHEISFTGDASVMKIQFDEATPFGSLLAYDVMNIDGHEVEAALRGENRKSDGGELVRWSMVLSDDRDSYCWRRSDWKEGSCSEPRFRCPSPRQSKTPARAERESIDACLHTLEEERSRYILLSRQEEPSSEELELACRCNTYKLEALAEEQGSVEDTESARVMLGCLTRHALHGEWREGTEIGRLMCTENAQRQGVPEETAKEYCSCATSSSRPGASKDDMLAIAKRCAQEHLTSQPDQ
jgi:hypothetical protein